MASRHRLQVLIPASVTPMLASGRTGSGRASGTDLESWTAGLLLSAVSVSGNRAFGITEGTSVIVLHSSSACMSLYCMPIGSGSLVCLLVREQCKTASHHVGVGGEKWELAEGIYFLKNRVKKHGFTSHVGDVALMASSHAEAILQFDGRDFGSWVAFLNDLQLDADYSKVIKKQAFREEVVCFRTPAKKSFAPTFVSARHALLCGEDEENDFERARTKLNTGSTLVEEFGNDDLVPMLRVMMEELSLQRDALTTVIGTSTLLRSWMEEATEATALRVTALEGYEPRSLPEI